MRIKCEDFINADEVKKEELINMIVEFETHNSISKDCLVAVVKHQQEKIETLEKLHRQEATWLDIIKESEFKEGKIDASKIKVTRIYREGDKEGVRVEMWKEEE